MKMLQVMLLPFLISFSCNGYCWGHKEWLVTCTQITPCHARVLIYKYFNPPLPKMMKTLPHKTISCDATKKNPHPQISYCINQLCVQIPFHVHINHKGFFDAKATFQYGLAFSNCFKYSCLSFFISAYLDFQFETVWSNLE